MLPELLQHICMFVSLHATLAVMIHKHVCCIAVTAIIVSGQLILGGSAVITALTGHHHPPFSGCVFCICPCHARLSVQSLSQKCTCLTCLHCFSSRDKLDVMLITVVVDCCCCYHSCCCDYDWFCLQACGCGCCCCYNSCGCDNG